MTDKFNLSMVFQLHKSKNMIKYAKNKRNHRCSFSRTGVHHPSQWRAGSGTYWNRPLFLSGTTRSSDGHGWQRVPPSQSVYACTYAYTLTPQTTRTPYMDGLGFKQPQNSMGETCSKSEFIRSITLGTDETATSVDFVLWATKPLFQSRPLFGRVSGMLDISPVTSSPAEVSRAVRTSAPGLALGSSAT